MSMKIIKKGTWDTFQDKGRSGWQHLGIPEAGSMDTVAAQLANLLVGNDPAEAVLEIFLPGPVLQFTSPALIAITGSARVITSNGIVVDNNRPVAIAAGTVLSFHATNSGRLAYLSVKGGWLLHKWLGSYSTCAGVENSGWKGRALQKEDIIPLRQNISLPLLPEEGMIRHLPWKHEPPIETEPAIRLLPDTHLSLLSEHALSQITSTSFSLHPNSNRMAYSLQGPTIGGIRAEMISAAVMRGSMQWLPEGRLHIFMADHPTTGGYPRIAQVITADAGRLAQWPISIPLHFKWVTRQQAEELLREQRTYLSKLEKAMHWRLTSYLTDAK